MAVYNNKLYVSGYDSLTATTQLWVSDGTTAGTTKVTNSHKNFDPQNLYAFQNRLIMTGYDTISGGDELFASDGTAAGTICPTPPSTAELAPFYPWKAWVPFNNALYFTACYTFWSDYQLCRYAEQPFGIEKQPAAGLSVYPNPTKGNFKVILPADTRNASIELYNNMGILISKQTTSNSVNSVDLSNHSPGIYILKVISNSRVIDSQKIIKE